MRCNVPNLPTARCNLVRPLVAVLQSLGQSSVRAFGGQIFKYACVVLVWCVERIGCTGAEPILDGFYAENEFFVPPYDALSCEISMLGWISRRAGYRANHAGCDTMPVGIPRFGLAALKSPWASTRHRRTWYRSRLSISQWISSHPYSRKNTYGS